MGIIPNFQTIPNNVLEITHICWNKLKNGCKKKEFINFAFQGNGKLILNVLLSIMAHALKNMASLFEAF